MRFFALALKTLKENYTTGQNPVAILVELPPVIVQYDESIKGNI